MIAMARLNGVLVGYAIVVRAGVRGKRVISWVTQFVVHEKHRRKGVGRTLLFSIWGFSNHLAWGLITANPYAVRALEKATRRRVSPKAVANRKRTLVRIGALNVPYVSAQSDVVANSQTAAINTQFFIEHSGLPAMLANVVTSDTEWSLGELEQGWEWLAFTFDDQAMIGLSGEEIEKMLGASDQVVKLALSRMGARLKPPMDSIHPH